MTDPYRFLGLCARANALVSGETAVLNAIRKQKAYLVLVAGDASERTTKQYRDKCAYYGVTCLRAGSAGDIGAAIGKAPRSAVAVTDKPFAEKIQTLFQTGDTSEL